MSQKVVWESTQEITVKLSGGELAFLKNLVEEKLSEHENAQEVLRLASANNILQNVINEGLKAGWALPADEDGNPLPTGKPVDELEVLDAE